MARGSRREGCKCAHARRRRTVAIHGEVEDGSMEDVSWYTVAIDAPTMGGGVTCSACKEY